MASYNYRSPGIKRLLREAKELSTPTSDYYACPLEENIFEWHFTIRGPSETLYEGGIYHGKIIFPTDYPMKPPEIIFLTPNGRFEVDKKICLSVSNYHPELWRPSWGVRTMLLAIIGFLPTPSLGAIGSTNIPDSQKTKLAAASATWRCPTCDKCNKDILIEEETKNDKEFAEEIKAISSQIYITQKEIEETEITSVEMPVKEKLSIKEEPKIEDTKPSESDLPFPWSRNHKIYLDRCLLNDIRPIKDEDLNNDNQTFHLSVPFYDWVSEEKASADKIKPANSTQEPNQQKFIPKTTIRPDQAFSLTFHLKSFATVILYCILIYALSKKLLFVFIFLLDKLS